MRARILTPEILDHLAPGDPRAVKSRRDLVRINAVMGQAPAMARLLWDFPAPKLIADLGGGDGRFMLGGGKRRGEKWPGGGGVVADRQPADRVETPCPFGQLARG